MRFVGLWHASTYTERVIYISLFRCCQMTCLWVIWLCSVIVVHVTHLIILVHWRIHWEIMAGSGKHVRIHHWVSLSTWELSLKTKVLLRIVCIWIEMSHHNWIWWAILIGMISAIVNQWVMNAVHCILCMSLRWTKIVSLVVRMLFGEWWADQIGWVALFRSRFWVLLLEHWVVERSQWWSKHRVTQELIIL